MKTEIGGIDCEEVLAKLSEYVDGALAPEVVSTIEAHLAGCSRCERFGGGFGRMVVSLRRQDAEELDPALLERVRAVIEERR